MNGKVPLASLTAAFFIVTTPAYAYLDPGTGSMILQGLIGGIAASVAVISIYFQKIKTFFLNLSGRSDDHKSVPDNDEHHP